MPMEWASFSKEPPRVAPPSGAPLWSEYSAKTSAELIFGWTSFIFEIKIARPPSINLSITSLSLLVHLSDFLFWKKKSRAKLPLYPIGRPDDKQDIGYCCCCFLIKKITHLHFHNCLGRFQKLRHCAPLSLYYYRRPTKYPIGFLAVSLKRLHNASPQASSPPSRFYNFGAVFHLAEFGLVIISTSTREEESKWRRRPVFVPIR